MRNLFSCRTWISAFFTFPFLVFPANAMCMRKRIEMKGKHILSKFLELNTQDDRAPCKICEEISGEEGRKKKLDLDLCRITASKKKCSNVISGRKKVIQLKGEFPFTFAEASNTGNWKMPNVGQIGKWADDNLRSLGVTHKHPANDRYVPEETTFDFCALALNESTREGKDYRKHSERIRQEEGNSKRWELMLFQRGRRPRGHPRGPYANDLTPAIIRLPENKNERAHYRTKKDIRFVQPCVTLPKSAYPPFEFPAPRRPLNRNSLTIY